MGNQFAENMANILSAGSTIIGDIESTKRQYESIADSPYDHIVVTRNELKSLASNLSIAGTVLTGAGGLTYFSAQAASRIGVGTALAQTSKELSVIGVKNNYWGRCGFNRNFCC